MKITIATVYKDKVCAEYSLSLAKLMARNASYQFGLSINEAALISEGRNKQFFLSAEDKSDYILYIDSDIEFSEDTLDKLMALDKPVATGIYFQRLYPFRPVIYTINPETNLIANLPDWPCTPFKVDACGAGLLLIRKDVFDKFTKVTDEPFEMIKNKTGTYAGEDTSFCLKCKEKGIEIWVDPTIEVGHVRSDVVKAGHWELAKKFLLAKTLPDKNEKGIDGWMSALALAWLGWQARKMDSIIELGSWKGRSTVELLRNCNGVVYAIDHFKGSQDETIHQEIIKIEGSIFSKFAENVDGYDNLIVVKMDNKKAHGLFPDNSIDMLFIDAGHSYENVSTDISNWGPKAKRLICGHDYQWEGVKKAVDKAFPNAMIYENIWYQEI